MSSWENSTRAIGGDFFTAVVDDILENRSLCTEVDLRISMLVDMRDDVWDRAQIEEPTDRSDATLFVPPAILFFLSVGVMFFGGRLFRPVAAIAAASFSFYAVYGFGRTFDSRAASCEVVVGIASSAGIVAALATSCVIKAALFLIGAAATGAVVHLTFSMFPQLHTLGEQPSFAERSLAYWALMLAAGIGGGLIVRWHSAPILEVLTASVGGAGLAYSLHAITLIASDPPHPDRRIFFVCGVVAALVGIIVQRRHRRRGGVCKKSDSDA